VEAVGAVRYRMKMKRRKASEAGELVFSSDALWSSPKSRV